VHAGKVDDNTVKEATCLAAGCDALERVDEAGIGAGCNEGEGWMKGGFEVDDDGDDGAF